VGNFYPPGSGSGSETLPLIVISVPDPELIGADHDPGISYPKFGSLNNRIRHHLLNFWTSMNLKRHHYSTRGTHFRSLCVLL
jgi:hypothetical protein